MCERPHPAASCLDRDADTLPWVRADPDGPLAPCSKWNEQILSYNRRDDVVEGSDMASVRFRWACMDVGKDC